MATKKKVTNQPELQEIIDALDDYRKQLYESKQVSSTKFSAMQTALHWAKQLIRDKYGVSREKRAIAWVK